jgi:dihydroflavonol-4-reductase
MIAVTGANGLLGSFIVRKLIEQGEPFVALKRKDSDTSLLQDVAHKITWRDADVTDAVSLREAFDQVTHVIHTAATVSFNPRRARQVMEINIEGTRNVVDECLALGIRRLVHISSIGALGVQRGQTRVDENNKWLEGSTNSVYAESKYQAELEVFRGQEEGLSTIIVNPSVILAPANWNKSSAQLFKYVWSEKPFYTEGDINIVDVRDVVNIVHKLLHHSLEGQRFICSAGSLSFKNFFDKIAIQFNKKAPSLKIGKTALKIGAAAESIRSRITGAEPMITKETARLSGSHFLFDNEKIRKALLYEFQPIDETLQWCCQYYMTEASRKKID